MYFCCSFVTHTLGYASRIVAGSSSTKMPRQRLEDSRITMRAVYSELGPRLVDESDVRSGFDCVLKGENFQCSQLLKHSIESLHVIGYTDLSKSFYLKGTR